MSIVDGDGKPITSPNGSASGANGVTQQGPAPRAGAAELMDDYEAGELAVQFDDQEPEDLLCWAFERFGDRVAIITSFQVDSLVLLDMAWNINPDVRVITVDTGRLPQETYELIDKVRDKYNIKIEVRYPEAAHVEGMVRKHGMNLFRKSVPMRLLCCHFRKVIPLQNALEDLDAWITGLRRDQWATRANIRKVDLDHDHGGIVKLNPLADWSEDDVWAYIREYDVPYHPLYDQGYTSIGCVPCTRPIQPGEDNRAGRWWWETNAPKECGMHCPIETGGFMHEVHAILGDEADIKKLSGH